MVDLACCAMLLRGDIKGNAASLAVFMLCTASFAPIEAYYIRGYAAVYIDDAYPDTVEFAVFSGWVCTGEWI